MTRDLGPRQLEALEFVEVARDGVLVSELADRLGLEPRRCHSVVAALADRDLVETTYDPGGVVRVWAPPGRAARRASEHRWNAALLAACRPTERRECPGCGLVDREDRFRVAGRW